MKRFNETYGKRQFLSRNEWADTYKAIHSESEEKVIVKVLVNKSTDEEYINNLSKEVKIIKEIKNIRENYITEEELEESKEQLKGNYILSLESINSKMLANGEAMLLNNKLKKEDEIIEHINAVNMEQVKDIINKVFNIENLAVCIVGKDVEGVQI